MCLQISEGLQVAVQKEFSENMTEYPDKMCEVNDFLLGRKSIYAICLKFLYAFMHVNDIVSFSVEQIASYVEATLEACEKISYIPIIPEEILLSYVLSYRVNGEYVDGSRAKIFQALYPRIAGKTMCEAALEVNYWCYEHATYAPSDNRTLGPLALMKSTLGRCGEESVFTVASLRSVGIPSRQCYVPRWSHCDDNHAWVEAWIEGKWHYLGACEPEPTLDKGWFTAAASKAMLTYSRAWSGFVSGEDVAGRNPLYTLINNTDTYAECAVLTVNVTRDGLPATGVEVKFQLVNFSEFFTIYSDVTDENGRVRFKTGLGSLYIHIWYDDRLLTKVIDVRETRVLNLELDDGLTLEELDGSLEAFDLVPPKERVYFEHSEERQAAHSERLVQCDAIRHAYCSTFSREETIDEFAAYRRNARGNLPELDAFLADTRFTKSEKNAILSTLRPKDFLDCSQEMLADSLLASRCYQGLFPDEIFRLYILAPRVADEMLLPQRSYIKKAFPDGFTSAKQILTWLQDHICIMPDYDVRNWYADCRGILKYGQSSVDSFYVAFVTICRTFGIPARRNPETLEYEWAEIHDNIVIFHSISEMKQEKSTERVEMKLVNQSGRMLRYDEQFTIGRFIGDCYQTMRYDKMLLKENMTLKIPRGFYMLVTTTRQIDGTLSVRIHRFTTQASHAISVNLPEDKTSTRIRSIDLMAGLPDGPIRELLTQSPKRRILVFADPGKEPTEHLLHEFLSCGDDYTANGYEVEIIISPDSNYENLTLKKVRDSLPTASVRICDDQGAFLHLHELMGVGDERLPFVLAVDSQNRGLYACANYNINTAQTLLNIQSLSAEQEKDS